MLQFSSHKRFKFALGLIPKISASNALADDLQVAVNVRRQATVRFKDHSCQILIGEHKRTDMCHQLN